MSELIDPRTCHAFAVLLAGHLARAASATCESPWQIELAEPQSEPLPHLETPVHYRLNFGDGLRGCCYLVLQSTDVPLFTSRQSDSSKAARAEEAVAAALRELVHAVVTAMPEDLAADHGLVTVQADACEQLDSPAAFGLELRATAEGGAQSILLLHFDSQLLSSLMTRGAGQGGVLDHANLDLVMDVELSCTLRFGQRQLSLREILDLASGAVVELDRQVEEPVELILDGKVIARGEAVIIDGNYGLRVTQVVQPVAC